MGEAQASHYREYVHARSIAADAQGDSCTCHGLKNNGGLSVRTASLCDISTVQRYWPMAADFYCSEYTVTGRLLL